MSALREIQHGLRRALVADDDAVGAAVLDDGLGAAARIALYRHHVFTTLTAVLRQTYPVVCRLVDRRFFDYAVDRYIREQPPSGPCLFEYGASFAAFLTAFPPCRDLAYLADVARLEWAMNEALHAADAAAIELTMLAGIPDDDRVRLGLRLHPAIRLVASPWPIDQIWRANQPDADPNATVDLAAGRACLEVSRRGADVVLRSLTPATHAFRLRLQRGEPLVTSVEAALATDGGFEAAAALRDLFEEGSVVGVDVSDDPDNTDERMETP
jgi:hypothetical protein